MLIGLGKKRLTTVSIKYHQTLACSLFSPTLVLLPFFSVKLIKSFFLDLRMFLKAATIVASLDKGKKKWKFKKTKLCGCSMPACVLVGDESWKINTKTNHIGEKNRQALPFYQTGHHVEKKQQSGQKPKESAFQAYPYTWSTCTIMLKQCSKSKGHTHSTDQHKSYPASKSAMEHASCSRQPLAKRSARERRIDRYTEDGHSGPVSIRHSTALVRKEAAHTSSCSCMGPCAVRLCRMLRHGAPKGRALRSWHHKGRAGLVHLLAFETSDPCTWQAIKLWHGEGPVCFIRQQFMIEICYNRVVKRTTNCFWSAMHICASYA